jgi:hypothetical protein
MLRSEALVLPPEEDDELEDVVSDVLLPDRDASSYLRSTLDLFPVDFFANNSSCVWEIMNTDEINVTATNIVIALVHTPSLLLFIKELQYSVCFSFHISIFEYIY